MREMRALSDIKAAHSPLNVTGAVPPALVNVYHCGKKSRDGFKSAGLEGSACLLWVF